MSSSDSSHHEGGSVPAYLYGVKTCSRTLKLIAMQDAKAEGSVTMVDAPVSLLVDK